MNRLDYGDVIALKTANNFWSAGQMVYIIVPEGDGELGLPEHAVCFKISPDGKPDKSQGAYEVPWAEMDFSTLQDAAELSLNAKIKKFGDEVKVKTAAKEAAERILNGIKGGDGRILKAFEMEIE